MSNFLGKSVNDALRMQDTYTPLAYTGEGGAEPKFAEYLGTTGSDTFLISGNGGITITGGGGSDTYVVTTGALVQLVVTDFGLADEVIDFSRYHNPYAFDDFEISDDGEGNAFISLKDPDLDVSVTLIGIDWQDVNASHLVTFDTVLEREVDNTSVVGSDGADYIKVRGEGNTITGAGEQDYIEVRGHDNEINGGTGDDEITIVFGNRSTIDAGIGDDTISIGGYSSVVSGGDGDDHILYEGDYHTLDGGAGADEFWGAGPETWVTYISARSGVALDVSRGGTAGDAAGDTYGNVRRFEGSQFDDRIDGTLVGNSLHILGRRGADKLFGSSSGDSLYGGHGNDFMQVGGGDDVAGGGTGDDEIYASYRGDDTIRGDDGNDVIGGGEGNDILIGDGSNARVFSSRTLNAHGSDTLFGGAGNDTLIGATWKDDGDKVVQEDEIITSAEDGGNLLWAGYGNDALYGGDSDDMMGGGYGYDTLHGLDGNDTLYGGKDWADWIPSRDDLFGDAGDDLIYAGSAEDNVWGGDGDDTLFGGDAADTIDGGAGGDILWGGAGADDITGGTGADHFSFVAGHGEDTVHDFNVDEDTLNLAGVAADFTSAEDVDAAVTITIIDGIGGALINTGGGDSIFLVGVRLRDIDDIDYIF